MNKFYYECWCGLVRNICESWALVFANIVFLGYWTYKSFIPATLDAPGINNMYYLVSFLLILLITRFIYLFSRPDTEDKSQLHALFQYSYGFMFLALLMSIGPFVVRYDDYHTHQRPIGLVLGCSVDKDAAKDLQCFPSDQGQSTDSQTSDKTFFNSTSALSELKESMVDVEIRRKELNGAKTIKSGDQKELNIAENALKEAEQKFHQLTSRGKDSSRVNLQWLFNIGGRTVCDSYGVGTCEITGGLLVPLYFIVLALLGGAISLTRRVPEYQKRSANSYKSFATVKEPFMTQGLVRETLAFQIIQFISAPLIAIVAYQLIDPANRSGAVALGFIAGFSSEAILMMIRQLTNKMAPGKTDSPSVTGSVTGEVTESAGGAGVEGATVTLIGDDISIETDKTGHYLIKNVPTGEVVVEVTYNDSSKLVKVTIEQGITTQCPTINFP